jgi:RNA-directed DNA polymerase
VRSSAFNEDKTRVVCLSEGFDFLGFTVRRYGNKSLIRPSKAAVRRIRERLRKAFLPAREQRRGGDQTAQPDHPGMGGLYRTQVSSKTFGTLDQYLWQLTYRWALFSHRNKSRPWVFARYFDKFNRSRQDRWVFGDRKSGAYMHRFAWTGIARHQMVRHRASPTTRP